jgi:dienelactone hydrolase
MLALATAFLPLLAAEAMQSVAAERITLRGHGGWELVGSWRMPSSRAPIAAVLLLHRAAGTRAEHDDLGAALAARGIASLALDLRGHGESTNLGRFQPPYAEHLHINEDAHRDVTAALDWMATRRGVDARRRAVVGASYSGEVAAVAARASGRTAAAYVMISPGSFSDTSIAAVSRGSARWLFIRTERESPASLVYIDSIFVALEARAPNAERRVLAGAGHATRIFQSHPRVVIEIADWLAAALGAA